MAKITKEDLQRAYSSSQRKKSRLLYEFYKEEYFNQGYTAHFIAEKISQDLGVKITTMMIYLIFSRIINKEKKARLKTPIQPQPLSGMPKGKEISQPPKVQKEEREWVFKNTDDEPRKNPFEEAFKGLL
jgi:hypothetical protein